MKNKIKIASTITTSLIVGLIMLSPITMFPNIAAQNTPNDIASLAGAKSMDVKALQKAGYESTPIGYLPHQCVIHVDNNTTINSDGSVILPNRTHVILPNCSGMAVNVVKSSAPTTNHWVEHGSVGIFGHAVSYFTAQWTIPPNPTNLSDLQTIFLWHGLQPGGPSDTPLIQPVLQWGSPTISNFWQIASWYCSSSSSCVEGPSYPVISGNTVTGKMVGTSCVSEHCNWEIDTTSISKGILRTSTLNYNSGSALYFLDGGVLEVYGVNNCGDYPPRGATPTTFNSFTIKDTTGTTITPTFSGTVDQNDGCHESVSASSSSVSLYYGNTS